LHAKYARVRNALEESKRKCREQEVQLRKSKTSSSILPSLSAPSTSTSRSIPIENVEVTTDQSPVRRLSNQRYPRQPQRQQKKRVNEQEELKKREEEDLRELIRLQEEEDARKYTTLYFHVQTRSNHFFTELARLLQEQYNSSPDTPYSGEFPIFPSDSNSQPPRSRNPFLTPTSTSNNNRANTSNNNNNNNSRIRPNNARHNAMENLLNEFMMGTNLNINEDATYEELLALDENVVKVGISKNKINTYPTHTYHSKQHKGNASTEESDNVQCMICFENYQDGEKLRRIPCLHTYHVPCIDVWLSEHKKCPICQIDLSEL
jgi:hypothetical protein